MINWNKFFGLVDPEAEHQRRLADIAESSRLAHEAHDAHMKAIDDEFQQSWGRAIEGLTGICDKHTAIEKAAKAVVEHRHEANLQELIDVLEEKLGGD